MKVPCESCIYGDKKLPICLTCDIKGFSSYEPVTRNSDSIPPTLSFDNLALEITNKLADTLIRKNSDYGNSFKNSYDKYGLTSTLIRLDDKLSRLDSLNQINKEQLVNDESIDDTLLDIAGYAILTLIARKNQND